MPVDTIKSLNNQQTFLRILIFSVVTIILWIAFSVFRSQKQTQISDELIQMALPLTPNLNLDVITRINTKKTYSDQELSNFPIYILKANSSGGESVSVMNSNGITTPISSGSGSTTTDIQNSANNSQTINPLSTGSAVSASSSGFLPFGP